MVPKLSPVFCRARIVIRGPLPSTKHDPNQVLCGGIPVILLFRILRQEDQAVKVSLGYTARTYLKEGLLTLINTVNLSFKGDTESTNRKGWGAKGDNDISLPPTIRSALQA